jgi:hypothetical protein
MTNWNRSTITQLLLTNDRAVEVAMVRLYDRQTTVEKVTSQTVNTNQRGFSSAHVSKGSYYARWVKSGKHLSGKHLENARKIALKYTRQLLEEVIAKSEAHKWTKKTVPAPVGQCWCGKCSPVGDSVGCPVVHSYDSYVENRMNSWAQVG